jgi:hypothetical protein
MDHVTRIPQTQQMVPTSLTQVFLDFLSSDSLQTIRSELAALRTLAVEYRNGIESRHVANLRKVADGIVSEAQDRYEMEDYEMEDLKKIITEHLATVFGVSGSLSAKDATVMLNILTGVVKAEREAKKIMEEQTLRIEWSSEIVEMLKKFLELIVFPDIEPEKRVIMATKAVQFFSGSRSGLAGGQQIVSLGRRLEEAI